MKNLTNKNWWKASAVRALKTTCQALGSTLPAGFVITPVMVEHADWTLIYVAIAWLGTGLLAGLASLLTSIAGLPEVKEEA